MCSYWRFSWGSLSNQKWGSALLKLNLCGWKVLNTNVSESPAATGVPREQSSDVQNVSTCQHPGQLDWKLVTMWCYQSQLQLLFKMLVFFTTLLLQHGSGIFLTRGFQLGIGITHLWVLSVQVSGIYSRLQNIFPWCCWRILSIFIRQRVRIIMLCLKTFFSVKIMFTHFYIRCDTYCF